MAQARTPEEIRAVRLIALTKEAFELFQGSLQQEKSKLEIDLRRATGELKSLDIAYKEAQDRYEITKETRRLKISYHRSIERDLDAIQVKVDLLKGFDGFSIGTLNTMDEHE